MATLRVYGRLLLLALALTGAGAVDGRIDVGGGVGSYEYFVSGCESQVESRDVVHGYLSLRQHIGRRPDVSLIAAAGFADDRLFGRPGVDGLARQRRFLQTSLRAAALSEPDVHTEFGVALLTRADHEGGWERRFHRVPVLPSLHVDVHLKRGLILLRAMADQHLPNMPFLRGGIGPRFRQGQTLTLSLAVPAPGMVNEHHLFDGVLEYRYGEGRGVHLGLAVVAGRVWPDGPRPNLFAGATLGYAWGRRAAVPD